MGLVTRTSVVKPAVAGATGGLLAKNKKPLPQPIKVTLPTTVSAVSDELNDYSFIIHGEKKIGKTTLVTQQEGTFLLTFDPLQKSLSILQAHCPNWDTFEAYLKKLEEAAAAGTYPYKRITIDGADIWHRLCQEKACRTLGISHPSDEEWGKGWDAVNVLFNKAVDRVLALPGGVWFISHSEWREIQTRKTNVKVTKLVPLLKSKAEDVLVGKVDGWFAYTYDEKRRVLVVRGDERTGAGHRVRGHFVTTDGRPVDEIYMGGSEEEAWANFDNAFHNRQEYATVDELFGIAAPTAAAPKGGTLLKKKLLIKKK